MAKVTFELVKAAVPDRYRRHSWAREYARCDLARPASELTIIAELMSTLPWLENAVQRDGSLYFSLQHDQSWLIQKRALHAALAIARRHVGETLTTLTTDTPAKAVEPYFIHQFALHHRSAYAHVAGGGGTWMMPDGHYGAGFAVDEMEDGSFFGYFLTPHTYRDSNRVLAASLLACILPEAGIGQVYTMSYNEIDIARNVPGLADHAVMAYSAAEQLIRAYKNEISALQWGGAPSAFLEEDDDARDLLLEQVRAGATITRTVREETDHDDYGGAMAYELSDGTPLAPHLVQRLINADIVRPLGWPLDCRREPGAPLAPLVFNPKVEASALTGRKSCVRFRAFQSYCPQRRHDNDGECAHPASRSDTCSEETCPITIQAYSEDVSLYGRGFADDPAFEEADWERDPLVRAIHPNTERSFAWRAAGEQALEAVVNQVLHSHFQLGVKRHLFGSENMAAVRKAIDESYLVLDEEMPGLGVIVKASDDLVRKVEMAKASQGEKNNVDA